ncbi:hypothetical protein L6452_10518 [Arctium lappa]|uniref:Uncharacterized protein n=1 Tax=Arctium lappa TaxID=4217 RepID=A0ACB9DNN6_ARCLA|nr:hypothetical protein L6452_10518 [Arctium lappa]
MSRITTYYFTPRPTRRFCPLLFVSQEHSYLVIVGLVGLARRPQSRATNVFPRKQLDSLLANSVRTHGVLPNVQTLMASVLFLRD